VPWAPPRDRDLTARQVAPGAAVAALGWQLLQSFGATYVGHVVKSASATNGVFALVLGMLAFLYFTATLVVISAEIDVVRVNGLHPRALMTPFTDDVDLTAADRRTYTDQATAQRNKPPHNVEVTFDTPPDRDHDTTEDDSDADPGVTKWLRHGRQVAVSTATSGGPGATTGPTSRTRPADAMSAVGVPARRVSDLGREIVARWPPVVVMEGSPDGSVGGDRAGPVGGAVRCGGDRAAPTRYQRGSRRSGRQRHAGGHGDAEPVLVGWDRGGRRGIRLPGAGPVAGVAVVGATAAGVLAAVRVAAECPAHPPPRHHLGMGVGGADDRRAGGVRGDRRAPGGPQPPAGAGVGAGRGGVRAGGGGVRGDRRVSGRRRAVLLAVAVAVLFATVAVLTKISAHRVATGGVTALLSVPAPYLLVVVAIAATVLQQSAFHAGALQTSVPTMLVSEPLIAVLLGVVVLGEHLAVSGRAALALPLAVLAMVTATAALARSAAA
jgi:Virulence factor BrkB